MDGKTGTFSVALSIMGTRLLYIFLVVSNAQVHYILLVFWNKHTNVHFFFQKINNSFKSKSPAEVYGWSFKRTALESPTGTVFYLHLMIYLTILVTI